MNPTEPEILTLICLPFAGGTSNAFRSFTAELGPGFRCIPVELPGHGSRFGQPLLNTLDEMTEFILNEVKKPIQAGPYAIFGHSMGGMLGYLLARRIRDHLLPPPLHLFISARRAGNITPPFYWKDLSREEFLERVGALGGIPKEILANRELMEIFEPILYNDIKALETHQHDEIAPLLVPITVFIGEEDDIPVEDALAWCRETIGTINVKLFPGGHFFAFERTRETAETIRRIIIESYQDTLAYRKAAMSTLNISHEE